MSCPRYTIEIDLALTADHVLTATGRLVDSRSRVVSARTFTEPVMADRLRNAVTDAAVSVAAWAAFDIQRYKRWPWIKKDAAEAPRLLGTARISSYAALRKAMQDDTPDQALLESAWNRSNENFGAALALGASRFRAALPTDPTATMSTDSGRYKKQVLPALQLLARAFQLVHTYPTIRPRTLPLVRSFWAIQDVRNRVGLQRRFMWLEHQADKLAKCENAEGIVAASDPDTVAVAKGDPLKSSSKWANAAVLVASVVGTLLAGRLLGGWPVGLASVVAVVISFAVTAFAYWRSLVCHSQIDAVWFQAAFRLAIAHFHTYAALQEPDTELSEEARAHLKISADIATALARAIAGIHYSLNAQWASRVRAWIAISRVDSRRALVEMTNRDGPYFVSILAGITATAANAQVMGYYVRQLNRRSTHKGLFKPLIKESYPPIKSVRQELTDHFELKDPRLIYNRACHEARTWNGTDAVPDGTDALEQAGREFSVDYLAKNLEWFRRDPTLRPLWLDNETKEKLEAIFAEMEQRTAPKTSASPATNWRIR